MPPRQTGFCLPTSTASPIWSSCFRRGRDCSAPSTKDSPGIPSSSSEAGQSQPLIYQVIIPPAANNTVYAFSDAEEGGVWKSIDSGATWAVANTGLPAVGGRVGPALRGPNTMPFILYVKLGDSFYRTTDGAATWTRLGTLANSGGAFAVDLTQEIADGPRTLYASIRSAVYRSTNEGATWQSTSVLPLGEGSAVAALAVDPFDRNTVLAAALGVGSGIGIYRSTDRGANFERVTTNTPNGDFVFDPYPFRRGVVYSSVLSGGCFVRSLNSGRNWGPEVACLNQAVGGARIAIDFGNLNNLWAATAAGIYRTLDLGANWSSRFGSVRPTLSVSSVPFDFNLPPNSQGRLELPFRTLETDRWAVPLNVTTTGESWLSVEGIAPTTPFTAIVRVSSANLAVGTYTATIRVTSSAVANGQSEVPHSVDGSPAGGRVHVYRSHICRYGPSGYVRRWRPRHPRGGRQPGLGGDRRQRRCTSSKPTNHIIRKIAAGCIGRAAGNGQAAFSGDGGGRRGVPPRSARHCRRYGRPAVPCRQRQRPNPPGFSGRIHRDIHRRRSRFGSSRRTRADRRPRR